MKEARVHRLLRLVTLMQSGRRCDADTLGKTLDVSRRTLFRDLSALTDAGIQFLYDGKEKTYTMESAVLLRSLDLTVAEALSLLLLTRVFIPRDMLPDFEPARQASAKIESLLPPTMQTHCGMLLDGIQVRWPPMAEGQRLGRTFEVLHRATAERRKVRMTYDSYYEGHSIDVVLCPYRVTFLSRAWYVVGYSELHQEVRTFKLDRVERLETLEVTFKRRRGFDLERYLGKAWSMIPEGKVRRIRVWFSPMMGGNVEEVLWHPTQQIEHRPDGSIIYEADVDGIREVSWWILGYGDQAEVLEPKELRELVATRLKAAAERYSPESTHMRLPKH